jgi:hypothetical protein
MTIITDALKSCYYGKNLASPISQQNKKGAVSSFFFVLNLSI